MLFWKCFLILGEFCFSKFECNVCSGFQNACLLYLEPSFEFTQRVDLSISEKLARPIQFVNWDEIDSQLSHRETVERRLEMVGNCHDSPITP